MSTRPVLSQPGRMHRCTECRIGDALGVLCSAGENAVESGIVRADSVVTPLDLSDLFNSDVRNLALEDAVFERDLGL